MQLPTSNEKTKCTCECSCTIPHQATIHIREGGAKTCITKMNHCYKDIRKTWYQPGKTLGNQVCNANLELCISASAIRKVLGRTCVTSAHDGCQVPLQRTSRIPVIADISERTCTCRLRALSGGLRTLLESPRHQTFWHAWRKGSANTWIGNVLGEIIYTGFKLIESLKKRSREVFKPWRRLVPLLPRGYTKLFLYFLTQHLVIYVLTWHLVIGADGI